MPAKDGLAIKNTSQKNKGFVVTTCMTSVNPAKNTPQRMAQTKQVRPNRCPESVGRRDQSKWRGLYNPQAEKEEQIERIREDGWFGAEG
jgi:hypothetical protein